MSEGSLVIGEIVFAELAAVFQGDGENLRRFLSDLHIMWPGEPVLRLTFQACDAARVCCSFPPV